jgi:hypothetical protein
MSLKVGEMLDYIGEKLGIPAKLRTSPAERAQRMQDMAQMAQQAAQANPEAAAGAVQQAMGV